MVFPLFPSSKVDEAKVNEVWFADDSVMIREAPTLDATREVWLLDQGCREVTWVKFDMLKLDERELQGFEVVNDPE